MKKLIALIFIAVLTTAGMTVQYGNSRNIRPSKGIVFRSLIDTNTTSSGTTYDSFNSIQAGPNELILAISVSSLASGADPTNWTVNMGMSWVKVASTNFNSAGANLSVWRGMTNNNSANGTLGPKYAATRTGNIIYVLGLSNVITTGTSGADAIKQINISTNATSNPGATLSTPTDSRNAIFAIVANVDSNGSATSAEAGWTEDRDNGYGTPSTGLSVIHRLTTPWMDNTVEVTQGAQQWAMICLEIGAAP